MLVAGHDDVGTQKRLLDMQLTRRCLVFSGT